MSRIPPSTRPDALRLALADLRRRIDSGATVAAAETVVTGWTDAQPRWVAYPVAFGNFATAATTVQYTIANLPAGTQWTAVWVEPGTLWASPSLDVWRIGVNVPATGGTASGTPKTVDVTTPDSIAQQAAAHYVATDRTGPCVVVAELTNGGADLATTLTAGTATIHLLLSVPGATTDTLPHA